MRTAKEPEDSVTSCKTHNIVLIGMPGAGKSTVGPLLAEKIGFRFADTDELVKQHDGRALKVIVSMEGYEAFLEIQKRAVTSEMFYHYVLATGGGVVKDQGLMQFFKQLGTVIFLRQDFSVLEGRLAPDRRLARAAGQTFRQLFDEREPLYVNYANFIINCENKTPDIIVNEIYRII